MSLDDLPFFTFDDMPFFEGSSGVDGDVKVDLDDDSEFSTLSCSSSCSDEPYEPYDSSESSDESSSDESPNNSSEADDNLEDIDNFEKDKLSSDVNMQYDEPPWFQNPSPSPVEKNCNTVGRPVTRQDNRNKQRRVRYAQKVREKQDIKAYQHLVHTGDFQRADSLLSQKIIPSRSGKRLFSETAQASEESKSAMVMKNLTAINKQMGTKSKHRASLIGRVAEGVPTAWLSEHLSVKKSFVRKAKARVDKGVDNAKVITEHRNEEAGRQGFPVALQNVVCDFFASRTHIFSGATTNTRKLTLSKKRLLLELYADWPSILRRTFQFDPSLLPLDNKIQTVLQTEVNRICCCCY